MPTIIAAPGAGNANSYATLALADHHFDQSLQAAGWNAQSDSDKQAALIGATRAIERLRLGGLREDTTTPQALHFPRAQDTDRTVSLEAFTSDADVAVQLLRTGINDDSETVEDSDGTEYTATTDYTIDEDAGTITVLGTGTMSDATTYYISYGYAIPERVERATCEQAYDLLMESQGGGGTDLPVDHQALQAAGVKEFALDGMAVTYTGPGSALCEAAMELLTGYTTRTAKIMPRGHGGW